MHRTEPPQLAKWLLEHGLPDDCDEGLAGDLLEGFRAGRSDGWYWRQALAISSVSWLKYFSRRRALLVFTALWATLAPTFAALVDKLEHSSHMLNPTWSLHHLFLMFWLWVALNTAFLWTGMLLFAVVHTRFAAPFDKARLKRAFGLTPLLFLPIYFATFVFMNLFAYPGLEVDSVSAKPFSEIADWTLRATVLRLPYFLTMLWAMWGATPLLRSFSTTLLDAWSPFKPNPANAPAPARTGPKPSLDSYGVKRFLAFLVGTGLLNALIVGFLICRLPASHSPTLRTLIERAILYVALGAIAGVVGIYLYWKNPASPFRKAAPLPFSLFALASAAGWMWVPSMVMFSEQLSGFTAVVGCIGALLLAVGLRHAVSLAFAPAYEAGFREKSEEHQLFSESLYRPPREAHGYVIAICIYAAGWALATHSNYTACTLLGLSAFLFAWKRTFVRADTVDDQREYKRAALRLALVFIPAVFVTLWALLDGVAHRNRVEADAALAAARATPTAGEDAKSDTPTPASANGISGYQSLILWPVLNKKEILPPIPRPVNLLAPGTSQPLVIHFDGPYFYFQPPHKQPSLNAHQAHGTPLAFDIKTNNFLSLIMQAHQKLGVSIPINRCRELQVDLLNSDNTVGFIRAAVFLTDSAAPDNQLYLGQQTLPSSEPENFRIKFTPLPESLHFAIPTPAKLRKFDEITVMLLPDTSNYDRAPKVAIEEFQIQPR